jgi:hypothetical protein
MNMEPEIMCIKRRGGGAAKGGFSTIIFDIQQSSKRTATGSWKTPHFEVLFNIRKGV